MMAIQAEAEAAAQAQSAGTPALAATTEAAEEQPAAAAAAAAPADTAPESVLESVTMNQVATGGGIGSGDQSVQDARVKFAKLQADMEANLAEVENRRAQQAKDFKMQGDDPSS